MNRTDFIREFFETHFEYGPEFDLTDDPEIAWDRTADRLHAPFGISVPVIIDGHWHMSYCSEIITEQTKLLSEGETDSYLHALQLHLDQHVTHRDMTAEDIEEQADKLIYSLSPQLMELVNKVQLGALAS